MNKQEVLRIMKQVADWQLINPSLSSGRYKEDDWPWATCYTGFMALADIAGPNNKYKDAMKAMGNRFNWKPAKRVYHADDHTIAQTYLELFLKDREYKMLNPTKERFDYILAHRSKNELVFENREYPMVAKATKATKATKAKTVVKAKTIMEPKRVKNDAIRYYWCDALFMGPPTWARLYAATGDTRYLKFIDDEWWLSSKFLYDETEKLWYRDSRYLLSKEVNGKKVFWGRGNGWAIAGLTRTLEHIPRDWPTRNRYEQQFKEMAEKIASLQQPDGLWRTSMLDPNSFPNKETSGSGFFTYALAWGINNDLLDVNRYEPIVWKGWRALTSCVSLEGMLQYVQPVGVDPKCVSQSDTEVYGPGAFLLAGKEVYILAKDEPAA